MQKKIKSERLKTTLNALVIITSTFIILIFIWRYVVKKIVVWTSDWLTRT